MKTMSADRSASTPADVLALNDAFLRRPAPLPWHRSPSFRRSALIALVTVAVGVLLLFFKKGDTQFAMGMCIALTFELCGCAWIALRFREARERKFLQTWFTISFGTKAVLAVVIFYFMRDRIAYDAPGYEVYGAVWADYWRGKISIAPVEHFTNMHNYSMIVGVLYYLTGTNYLAPCFTNCLIGALLVPILYQTAREHFDSVSARNAAIFAAIVASWTTWSAIAMRDMLTIFFLALATRELLSMTRRVRWPMLIRLALWGIGVWEMRPYIGLMLVLVTGSTLVFRITRHPVLRGVLALGFIGLLALLFFHGGTQTLLADLIQSQTEQINGARQAMVATAYGNDDRSWGLHEHFHGIGDVAKFLPVAVFYLLAGPFIWQYGAMHVVLLIPELLTWYALLFFGARGCWRLRRHGVQIPLVAFFVIAAILYALISDAYAIAIRHRSQLDIPLILWASVGLPKRLPKFLAGKDAPA